jgi:outer membrane protein assembly factor BamB
MPGRFACRLAWATIWARGGRVTKRFIVPALALASVVALHADNWPQWRGPQLNGVSAEKGLPVKWSIETGENVAWKLAMPSRSGATPIVWKDHVFLNIATELRTGSLELWAVDRSKGTVAWKKPLSGGNNMQRKQTMASPSPVTDGTTVWVLTGTGILKAFDFGGNELWTRDIQTDYGRFGLNWGFASSPLLYQGALFIPVLHGMKTDDPSYLLKIDAKSGKTIWKVERPTDAIRESPDAYITPSLLQYAKTTEIVLNGGDVVTGHDPESGKELWRVKGLNPDNDPNYRIIASTLVVGDLIIAPTRVKPMLAIKAGGRGDVTASHLAWTFDEGPDVPTPVSDGKLLYVVRDNGVVFALDLKTGKPVWGPERLKADNYSASPTLADGRIYVTSETQGVTSVFTAGPKFELLAENPTNEYTLSSISVSEGQLFLRTDAHLYAIGQRKKQ